MTAHRIIPATIGDAGALSEVIAEAFQDLPPSRWLIPGPTARRQVLPGYFRILVEHALAGGTADTTPGRTAVALWLPVSTGGPVPLDGYDVRLAEVAGPWLARFSAFDAVLARHHPAGIAHHHLAILAVHPAHQGHGTGTALLAAHHALLDAAGTPAYLEAACERSRALYLRHGYTNHGPPIHLADGVPMFPLWRQPTSPAARVLSSAHGRYWTG